MKWKQMKNKLRTEEIFSQVKVGLVGEKKLENTQGNKQKSTNSAVTSGASS